MERREKENIILSKNNVEMQLQETIKMLDDISKQHAESEADRHRLYRAFAEGRNGSTPSSNRNSYNDDSDDEAYRFHDNQVFFLFFFSNYWYINFISIF